MDRQGLIDPNIFNRSIYIRRNKYHSVREIVVDGKGKWQSLCTAIVVSPHGSLPTQEMDEEAVHDDDDDAIRKKYS